MKYIYQQYLSLTAGQRKLLCFLAYTGVIFDVRMKVVYGKCEDISSEQLDKTVKSLSVYLRLHHYYLGDYSLDIHYVTPLLVYMLKEMPQWLEHFDKLYKKYQNVERKVFLHKLKLCADGQGSKLDIVTHSLQTTELLVPLSAEPVFLPMMLDMSSYRITDFVDQAAYWQAVHDVSDPHNVLGKIAELGYKQMSVEKRATVKSLVALYDFYKQGRYDEIAASYKNLYAYLLQAWHAIYAADYDKTFEMVTKAVRENNKNRDAAHKGFFSMPLNNYLLVMVYYLKRSDEGKKLGAILNKEAFRTEADYRPSYWLANYLKYGNEPSVQAFSSIKSLLPLRQYLGMQLVGFFKKNVQWPQKLPLQPNMHILRHEMAECCELSEEERQHLTEAFGGQPLISRLRYKAPWEFLLDELTPEKEEENTQTEKSVRVSYLINFDRVEVREQSRLKSGAWGAGKRMSLDTFRRGTDFMDDTDRKIANSVTSYYSYDIDIKKVLPHLIGSDRVYTGSYAPFDPVAICEEKPYLVINRTKKGFTVTSNVGDAKMDSDVVYRKDSNTQYTVITMTERQRNYYRKLLNIGTFPPEAEGALREFLPKVSDVVEVHSDLVEGGTTLEHRDGTGQLCLQMMPSADTRNLFCVYCYARPLPDGQTFFEPAKGMNPCVAESSEGRFQVTRDMKTERENFSMISVFLEQSDFVSDQFDFSDPFADRQPVWLPAEGLLQLMQFVQEQPDRFYMEWPEGGQLNLKSSQPSSWNMQLKSKNGWFEVEGEIPIDDDTVLSAEQLLMLVAQSTTKSGFVRLGESEFLAISDKLRKQLARIESLAVNNRGHLQISELHASLLGSALSGEVEVKHDKRIDELQKKIKKSMALLPDVPKRLKADLRDYQMEGFQWMVRMTGWGSGVCLADDMGLGKTVQTIAFLLHTSTEGAALVAAPASVVLNWRRELERFAPSLNVVILNTVENRHDAIANATKGDVVLTTYGLFVTESESLTEKEWNTVCLDEAHVIKNRETKTSDVVMKLQAKNRIILTGTPVQNHLGELWNLYQFINPGLLGGYDQFSQKYIVPIEQQDNKERSRQLKRIVQPFILRRTKQEVIEELPDKTEINMPVELSDDELAVYEVIRRKAKQMLEDEQGGAVSVNTLAEITRLRQAACSAQLAEKSWKGECSKINTLLSLLEEIVGGGNSVLVFSQFTSFLSMVREALDKQKTAYLYLDGSIPMKKREQLVQDFQNGKCPVFLISLKAGGLGLNLTGANYVVHLDPWWNPAIEQQATDRAYRIGQRQNVTVYHLISQHTIEEKILRLHETKRNLADAMLSGTNESHKLTSRELLQMIGG